MEPINERNEFSQDLMDNNEKLEDSLNAKPDAYKDLMTSYNKQMKDGIKKKKPAVWRKEAIWGIEPQFNHDKNQKKFNYKSAVN